MMPSLLATLVLVDEEGFECANEKIDICHNNNG